MVLSLNTMPTYHGGFPISTSNLSSIQHLISKLQQQVEHLVDSNKRQRIETATIQQIFSTFTDSENEDQEEKDPENSAIQHQESATTEIEPEISEPEIQTSIIQQSEAIDLHNNNKKIIEHKGNTANPATLITDPESATNPNSYQIQEDDEVQISDTSSKNSITDPIVTQNQQQKIQPKIPKTIPNSDPKLQHHHSPVTVTRPAADSGASAENRGDLRSDRFEGGEDERRLPPPDRHREPAAVEGDGNVRSNTEAGASAKEKKEESAASSLTVASETGVGVHRTSGGGLNRHRHGRTLPFAAKPPVLIAAVFPWDRDDEMFTETTPVVDSIAEEDAAEASRLRKCDHRPATIGAATSGLPFGCGSIDGAGSPGCGRASGANMGAELLEAAAQGWWLGALVLHSEEAQGRRRSCGEGGLGFQPACPPDMGSYSMGLTHFRMKKAPFTNNCAKTYFLTFKGSKNIFASPIKLWDPGGNFSFICSRVEIIV